MKKTLENYTLRSEALRRHEKDKRKEDLWRWLMLAAVGYTFVCWLVVR